jgi:glutamyl-tRNA synthetase
LVLRLEDLDVERSTQAHIDNTLRDLEWLGLDWDGEPRRQSANRERIVDAARSLVTRGLAYACTCTRADLRAALSAPQAGVTELRYSGRCRNRYASPEGAAREAHAPPALRFRVRDGHIPVEDGCVGRVLFDVQRDCGDFLILRRDQIPSYQLAVVVDDMADAVTEVVRGDDLLASAARQQLLYEAFDTSPPLWWHVPLVVDEAGQRFAKRTDALSLAALRSAGVASTTIVGWVARHSGWPDAEPVVAAELVASFNWARVPKGNVTFAASSDLTAALRG